MKKYSKRSIALLIILFTLLFHFLFVYFFTNVRFDLSKSPAAFKKLVQEILSKTQPLKQKDELAHNFVSHAPNNAPVIYRSDSDDADQPQTKQEPIKEDKKEITKEMETAEEPILDDPTMDRQDNQEDESTEVTPDKSDKNKEVEIQEEQIEKEENRKEEEIPEESVVPETNQETTTIIPQKQKTAKQSNKSDKRRKPSITLDQLALQQVLKRDMELRKRYFFPKKDNPSDYAKASSDKSNKPSPTNNPSNRQNISMAQLAQGFLNHMGAITTIGNKNGKPTEQQIAFERYAVKIAQCLETSFKISNNKQVCRMQQSDMEIVLEVNAQGKLSMLVIAQSSSNPVVDQFALEVFKNASSSFPVPPQSIGNVFRIAFMLNHISNLAFMSNGVLTAGRQ